MFIQPCKALIVPCFACESKVSSDPSSTLVSEIYNPFSDSDKLIIHDLQLSSSANRALYLANTQIWTQEKLQSSVSTNPITFRIHQGYIPKSWKKHLKSGKNKAKISSSLIQIQRTI